MAWQSDKQRERERETQTDKDWPDGKAGRKIGNAIGRQIGRGYNNEKWEVFHSLSKSGAADSAMCGSEMSTTPSSLFNASEKEALFIDMFKVKVKAKA